MLRRLLLVDDDEDVLGIITEFLRSVGYDVVAAGSGRGARDLILDPNERFDGAVIDWGLPDLPGREVVLALGRHQPSCGVLVTTGHGDDVVSDAIVGTQVHGILRKPFTMQGLRMRLDALLADRTA
jgi:DNA-binding response OmpR family regulator